MLISVSRRIATVGQWRYPFLLTPVKRFLVTHLPVNVASRQGSWKQIRNWCCTFTTTEMFTVGRHSHREDNINLAEHYKQYGYVIIQDLLSSSEVVSLLDEMVAICRGARGPIPGIESNDCKRTDVEVLEKYLCIHFPHKISTCIHDLVKEPKTVSVLQQCIGPNVKSMQTMMFMKGPGKRGQACHQDEYYIPTRDRSLCASWVALDDATVENGCIWIIPGSHHRGIIYPMSDQSNDERYDSSGESIGHNYPESAWQPVPLTSGSAIFFNGYLLHRSLPNKSKSFRRAFANHYMSAESLLPWTNDGRFDTKDDMRDFILVCGEDPYAGLKPLQNFTKPFVRAEVRKEGAVFNEVA